MWVTRMDERVVLPRAPLWVGYDIRELIAKIHLIANAMLVEAGLPDLAPELFSHLE